MTDERNTILDDLAQVIGFSKTLSLVKWFGGSNVVIPAQRPDDCILTKVIGPAAVRRLSNEFGGDQIFIPRLAQGIFIAEDSRCAYRLYALGVPESQINEFMKSNRRRQKIKIEKSSAASNDPAPLNIAVLLEIFKDFPDVMERKI